MIRHSPRQSGFSLAELLVTALIFGIGLLGLAALQVSTLRSNTGGRNRVTASALAEGCLSAIQAEGSLSWSYAAGVMGSSVAYGGTKTYTSGPATDSFGNFDINGLPVLAADPTRIFQVNWARLSSTATPTAPITGMDMYEFVVTVTWQDQAADAKGVALPATTLTLSRLIRY